MSIDIGDVGFFNNLQLEKEDWEDWEWDEIGFFKPLSRGVTIIDGEIGGGKTTVEVLISYKCKKYFGQGVIVDNPAIMKPAFGKFEILDWYALVDNLGILAKKLKMAKYMVLSRYMDDLFKSVGIDPYNKTVNIDEAHKLLNKRRGMADVVIIIGQLARQIRHYGSLLQLSSQQAIKNLDQNEGISFATAKIQCSYDQIEKVSYYAIKSKFTPLRAVYPMRINPDNWKELYESFCPAQPEIPGRELVEIGG